VGLCGGRRRAVGAHEFEERTDPAMNTPTQDLRARNLRTVGALAGLFLLPLLLSFWMYYGGAWQPAGRTNHGELLDPVRALPLGQWPEGREALRGKWTLVYLGAGPCERACRNALLVMRQTRLSLNNEMERVNRVLLASGGCCDAAFIGREHPGLRMLDAGNSAAQATWQQFPQTDLANSLFLVDPLGNLVMRHDARSNPKGLLQDLKKLLKLSHIG
jgi:hypothetical protein